MVRALLAGTKTQTRRLLGRGNTLFDGRSWDKNVTDDNVDFASAWIDNGPSPAGNPGPYLKARWNYGKIYHPPSDETLVARLYPRIPPGARLWVKETWSTSLAYEDLKPSEMGGEEPLRFDADGQTTRWTKGTAGSGKLRPSIFMPRWASRLTLAVTDIRIQRLQEISEIDAQAEGAELGGDNTQYGDERNYYEGYWDLWNQINGEGAWEKNPWVIAYTFTVDHRNIDQ